MSQNSSATLFLQQIPLSVTKDELSNYLSPTKPAHFFLVQKKGSDAHLGMAYAHYTTKEEAEEAKNTLKGVQLGEKKIAISIAKKKKKVDEPKVHEAAVKKVEKKCFQVYVAGFDATVSQKQLYKKMRKAAEFESIEMKSGYAVINCKTLSEAVKAVEKLNGHIFKGKSLTVVRKTARHRVIVRNLDFKTTEQDLMKAFESHGTIIEVSLARKVNNDFRGFAFVEFLSLEQAEKAIKEVNGKKILKRIVAVDMALKKDDYEKEKTNQEKIAKQEEEEKEHGALNVKDDEEFDMEAEVDAPHLDTIEENDRLMSLFDSIGAEEEEERETETKEKRKERKPKIRPQTDENFSCKVFVRNLPLDTTKDELCEVLSTFGPVSQCLLVKDKKTGMFKNSAFVTFENESDAQNAIEKSKFFNPNPSITLIREENQESIMFKGVPLTIFPAISNNELENVETERKKKEEKASPFVISKVRLSIRCLPTTVTEDSLTSLITGKCQKKIPLKVHIIRTPENNKSKGYGFIKCTSEKDAALVVEKMNGHAFENSTKSLLVEFAKEKKSVLELQQQRREGQKRKREDDKGKDLKRKKFENNETRKEAPKNNMKAKLTTNNPRLKPTKKIEKNLKEKIQKKTKVEKDSFDSLVSQYKKKLQKMHSNEK